jgi:hypothetical protein
MAIVKIMTEGNDNLLTEDDSYLIAEKEFPVHPSLQWVDCPDDTTTRHQYVNGSFSEPGQAKQKQPDETEALIRQEIRQLAIDSLKSKGKLKETVK